LKWIHEEFPEMRTFGWQDGYSAFSVSKSIVPKVAEYIKTQRGHHQKKKTFEDEYLDLLDLHEIGTIDERYIFG
jgi:putative transposase